MGRTILSVVCAGFLFWVCLPSSSQAAGIPPKPTFTPEEQALLDKGDPAWQEQQFTDKDGRQAGRGVVYIVINAAPEKIWKTVLDFDQYPYFYPNVSKAKLTKKEGNTYYVNFVLCVLLVHVNYNVTQTLYPDQNRCTWEMDQSKKNDFQETTGFWQIWPLGPNKSLVGYSVDITAGRYIPEWVVNEVKKIGLTSWGLKKVATCMKDRVEEGDAFQKEADFKK